MKKLRFLVFILLTLVICLPTIITAQNFEKQFDEVLRDKDFENSPGFAVLIAKDGEIIYRKAFGYANLELDVKLKPEHIFRIGSITKQFTACAILKLEEEGKLSIQDDISKYIEDYPTHGHTITIEHLLTHTSGIKSYTGLKKWDSEMHKKDFSPVEMVDFFKNEPMDFAPGEQFRYNNSAYFILGYIIELVSGKKYDEYLAQNFFEPLGMDNTMYGSTSKIIKNRADGYQKQKGEYVNANFLSMSQPYAAGSLLSTVDDLNVWYKAVWNDQVISKESRKKAHSSFKLNNGKATGYGYGWFLGNIQESPMIQHGGGIHGYLTASLYLPNDKVFVTVFSNCNSNPPGDIANKLAAIAINKPFEWKEISMSQNDLKEYEGVYVSDDDTKRTLVEENDSLIYILPTGNRARLIPFSKDKFFRKDMLGSYVFTRNSEGNITAMKTITTNYQPTEWNKTNEAIELKKELVLPDELLQKYVGKYELMPEFILTITREGKSIFVQATGQSKGEIFASEKHKFFSKEVNAQFTFLLDEKGIVTGLTLHQNGEHQAKKIE